jgi:hypothetical protein
MLHHPLTTHYALLHTCINKCPTCVQKYPSIFTPPLSSPFRCMSVLTCTSHYYHLETDDILWRLPIAILSLWNPFTKLLYQWASTRSTLILTQVLTVNVPIYIYINTTVHSKPSWLSAMNSKLTTRDNIARQYAYSQPRVLQSAVALINNMVHRFFAVASEKLKYVLISLTMSVRIEVL